MPEMTSYDVGWTAGILDGEGCVKLYPNKGSARGTYMTLTIRVDATCQATVLKLQKLWGGSISTTKCPSRKGQRPVHCWTLAAKGSVVLLEAVEPFLTEKKEQVFFALLHQETITRGRKPVSDAIMTFRQELGQRLRDLKKAVA